MKGARSEAEELNSRKRSQRTQKKETAASARLAEPSGSRPDEFRRIDRREWVREEISAQLLHLCLPFCVLCDLLRLLILPLCGLGRRS
jgi:hypothetical protein